MKEKNDTGAKKSGMSMLIVGLVIVAVVVGAFLIMQRNETPEPMTQDGSSSEGSEMMEDGDIVEEDGPMTEDEEMMEGVSVVEVEGGSFYFDPSEIRVKKGEKVKIVLNSVDAMHDFVIDELNVKTPVIRSGETSSVEFTAEIAGEFEYYCNVGNHRAQGMVGKLIVE